MFPKSLKKSASKYRRFEGWKPSSRSSGSSDSLWVGDIGSAMAEETSSWLDMGSTRRGSKGGVFSKMLSRRASPSLVVLCLNEPSTVMSSCRADSLLSPNQKCCNNTWMGIDKSGPERVKIENRS